MRAFTIVSLIALLISACAPASNAIGDVAKSALSGAPAQVYPLGIECIAYPLNGVPRVLLDRPQAEFPAEEAEFRLLAYVNEEPVFEAPIDPRAADDGSGLLSVDLPALADLSQGEKTVRVALLAIGAEGEELIDEMEFTFEAPPGLEIIDPLPDEATGVVLAVAGRSMTVQVALENVEAGALELVTRPVGAPATPPESSRRIPRKGRGLALPSGQGEIVSFDWRAAEGQRGVESIVFARARSDRAMLCSYYRVVTVTVPQDFDELAGEYFVEIMLGMWFDGSKSLRTSRFTSDPVFWFKNGRGTQGETDVTNILTQAIPELTGGRFKAQFRTDTSPPPDRNQVITIDLNSNSNMGIARPTSADFNNGGGIRITGGEINLVSAFIQGVDQWNVTLVKHEAAHVLVGRGGHSAIYGALLAQGWSHPVMQPYERAAWDLFYQLPVGTSLQQLQTAGIITQPMVTVEPRVDSSYPAGNTISKTRLEGSVGDTIWLNGRSLLYPWGCGTSLTFPAPTVSFNGVTTSGAKVASMTEDCNYLEVVIPPGATTGPLTVTAYGRTSAPVTFTVKP